MTSRAERSPALAEHRLLGDGRSAALLRPDSEINWWCVPELDSPPVLWSLLDPAGARAVWCDLEAVSVDPRPAGQTALTTVRCGPAMLECWDALLPNGDGGSALVRLVRCVTGPLEVTHALSLGGFDAPVARWDGATAVLQQGPVTVTGGTAELHGQVMCSRVCAPQGTWAALVIAFGSAHAADPSAWAAELTAIEARVARAEQALRLPTLLPERVLDALAVMRACTDARSGAVVAAVTTSLPEAPGADRQFDYRFSWLRDTSLAVSVAALLGDGGGGRTYLGFIREMARGDPRALTSPLRDIRGGPVPVEREVSGVAGWAGSLPVRVGNNAAGQVQYDALGFLLEGLSVHVQTGGRLEDDMWALACRTADEMAVAPLVPTAGTWELRVPRLLVCADIGRWIALDRAIWIARGWRPRTRRRHWIVARRHARHRVLQALRPDGSLPQAYGDDETTADATALLAVIFGLLKGRDPRARRLVDATIDVLGVGPYLHRYPPGGQDGFAGREGAFLPVCWWRVSALAKTGRIDQARALAVDLDRRLPRLMPEEINPDTGDGLGNIPLVWSHAEAARALYLLDAAINRKRYGPVGHALWRIGRYVSLRRAHRARQPG
ncbi:MAG: hypothetical protein DLM58_00830 [Pseudonocardiales bacterium]|nr:MAG: hypothetical protein DLM58_00830 [Pseudonocardiales bacterium]